MVNMKGVRKKQGFAYVLLNAIWWDDADVNYKETWSDMFTTQSFTMSITISPLHVAFLDALETLVSLPLLFFDSVFPLYTWK